MEEETMWGWKIPFHSNLTYGQHIVLKKGIQGPLQDRFPGSRIRVVIKEGEKNGFYVSGTREVAEHVARLLSKRAANYLYGTDVSFGIEEVLEEVAVPEEEEIDERLLRIIAEAEERTQRFTNTSIEFLSKRISELDAENQRIKDLLSKKEKPTREEALEAITQSCASEIADIAGLYDYIFAAGIEIKDIALAKKSPLDYAEEKIGDYAKKFATDELDALLSMPLKPFEESDRCPVNPEDYKRMKLERDGLLKVITAAPAEVKQIVETCLAAELKRKQETVDKYEDAEKSYNELLQKAKEIQAVYSKAKEEQERRVQRLKLVSSEFELLSQLELRFIVQRNESSVSVMVGSNKDSNSRYNKDIDEFIRKVSKGYSLQAVRHEDKIIYSIAGGNAENIERDIYNRLTTIKDSPFNYLGIKLTVCMLPFKN